MYPVSSIYPTPLFDKLDEFLLEFEGHDQEIFAGVGVEGTAAAYALVWEYGNVRQSKPGPKTVMGTNPRGEMVWLSIQAPFGWIRVNEPYFWDIIKEGFSRMKFAQPDAHAMTVEMERGATWMVKQMVPVLKDSVPVDTGQLQSEIVVIEPNDPILERETPEYTLSLGEGDYGQP